MTRVSVGRGALGVAIFAGLWVSSAPAQAKVEGLPYLDNETIGTFHVIERAVQGPADAFDGLHWAPDLLDKMASDDAMGPLRYVIAFAAYAVAQTSIRTPAYRRPYQQVMSALIDKMLDHKAWEDWLARWGDNPLGPDNIMYTGHLLYMMTLHRQLFGDTTFEKPAKLVNPGGPEFETDLPSLAASIAKQAAEGLDAAGAHTWNVACEPGRIFLPCNAPHRLAQVHFDRVYGTGYAASNAQWLQDLRTRWVHPEHKVLYDLFYPFGAEMASKGSKPPEMNTRVSGVYNGWSIWMLANLDPAWATELYPAYKKHFVVSGAESPKSDGRTLVLDRTGATGLAGDALDLIATGFGMVAARQMNDQALFAALESSWSLQFGAPEWTEDGTQFRRAFPLIPLMIQNGFPLLALSTTPGADLAAIAARPANLHQYGMPHLDRVEGGTVFVNQAVYDEPEQNLIVTLNGGKATSGPVKLFCARLRFDRPHEVRRNGVLYEDWEWASGVLVVTTPPLTATEETYEVRQVAEHTDETDRGAGLICSASRVAPGGLLHFALLLLAAVAAVHWRAARQVRQVGGRRRLGPRP